MERNEIKTFNDLRWYLTNRIFTSEVLSEFDYSGIYSVIYQGWKGSITFITYNESTGMIRLMVPDSNDVMIIENSNFDKVISIIKDENHQCKCGWLRVKGQMCPLCGTKVY